MSDYLNQSEIDRLADVLATLSAALMQMPDNRHAYTYTIRGFDQSPYITRTLLPRIGDLRPMLHRIHREDQDEHMHNHPWRTAQFRIISGGYVEERLVGDKIETRRLGPGDVNVLDASTFHRVVEVYPNTWTLGIVGERVQDWGFLVDGALVPWRDYFASKGHAVKVASLS